MKNRRIISLLSLVLALLSLHSVVFAHGTEKHVKSASDDAQMKKLHAMMPMISLSSAGLEAALEKNDLPVVEKEAEKIIAAIPDLKKSKPHKNIKQRKAFVKLATELEETITSTAVLAKQGDFAGAKIAYKKAEKTCTECHAKFRG